MPCGLVLDLWSNYNYRRMENAGEKIIFVKAERTVSTD